jgi:hypothetical protein
MYFNVRKASTRQAWYKERCRNSKGQFLKDHMKIVLAFQEQHSKDFHMQSIIVPLADRGYSSQNQLVLLCYFWQ